MPAYDFKCQTCDNTATIVVSIKEKIKTPVCVKCSESMIRQYELGAITFKGTGYYSTDK